MMNNVKKGTTTVGIITKEGIILAADKRASMGYLIADKNAKKIHKINKNTVMTFAGSVADSQMLLRYIKSQINLYKIRKGKEANVNAITTLFSHYIFANAHTFAPYQIQFIVGGHDSSGFHLYSLDMGGSKMESNNFTSTGSGSPMAYGVLEDQYKKNMTLNNGIKLAVKAITTAIKRDLATGNGITLVVIDKNGANFLDEKKIKQLVN